MTKKNIKTAFISILIGIPVLVFAVLFFLMILISGCGPDDSHLYEQNQALWWILQPCKDSFGLCYKGDDDQNFTKKVDRNNIVSKIVEKSTDEGWNIPGLKIEINDEDVDYLGSLFLAPVNQRGYLMSYHPRGKFIVSRLNSPTMISNLSGGLQMCKRWIFSLKKDPDDIRRTRWFYTNDPNSIDSQNAITLAGDRTNDACILSLGDFRDKGEPGYWKPYDYSQIKFESVESIDRLVRILREVKLSILRISQKFWDLRMKEIEDGKIYVGLGG